MNEIQTKLDDLRKSGWTDAAIGDEMGFGRVTVSRWRSGAQYPDHPKPVLMAMDAMLLKKRIPKGKRYTRSRADGKQNGNPSKNGE